MNNVPTSSDAPDLGPLHDAALPVGAEGAWIREAIEELTGRLDRMETEVRTRRVVVVDERGAERIVAECPNTRERPALVEVRAADGADSHVTLLAHNGMEGDDPSVEVDLSVDGTIHSRWMAAPAGGFAWELGRPAHIGRNDVRSSLEVACVEVASGYSDSWARPVTEDEPGESPDLQTRPDLDAHRDPQSTGEQGDHGDSRIQELTAVMAEYKAAIADSMANLAIEDDEAWVAAATEDHKRITSIFDRLGRLW